MKADIRWIDNPEVFQVNRRKVHSDHVVYRSREDFQRDHRDYYQSLNGEWSFCFSRNARDRRKDFYLPSCDDSGFDRILVPGHIELAGYDQIQYVNIQYPWEGHEFRKPPFTLGEPEPGMFSESEYNPVGSYRRTFRLEEGLRGKKVSIRFDGVEQALYVWLNGQFIGYGEDSFTPSEFDLTEALQEGDNLLAVEVHKRSTAAFLEDQDFFRFSGIFRDVVLVGRTENYLNDLWIRPRLLEDGTGTVELRFLFEDVTDGAVAAYRILTPEGEVAAAGASPIAEVCRFQTALPDPVLPWSYGSPHLYHLEITVRDRLGEVLGFVAYPFGFRRIEIRDGVMLLNGKRLIVNGVNRHEWSPRTGRVLTEAEMEQDLDIILRNNINAVRTCHYPNRTAWYSMCDRAGIYVMAEVNLESHGTWQIMGKCEPSVNIPGSVPQWLEPVMDRARSNFELLKNHTSILFWSLGNESYAGDNFWKMDEYYKSVDPDRLTHYEGNFWNPAYEDCVSDIKSRMYAKPREIADYLEHDPKKPFLICEFMHSMGNSVGGMGSYMELLDRYEGYQGGFIWDLIDQALYVQDEAGDRTVLRYGGDFDDRPSDYEFSGNGLVFADRSEKPAMQEVRYYYGKYRD